MPLIAFFRGFLAVTLFSLSSLTLLAQSGVSGHTVPPGPRARFLYAVTGDISDILEFTIGADGTLSGPQYFSVSSGGPQMVVADPKGKFAFAIEPAGVLAFTVDSKSGALTNVPGSPFPVGGYGDYPTAIAIDPGGNFVYVTVADIASPYVGAYRIDRSTGALTPPTVVSVLYFGNQPRPTSIYVEPSGEVLYLVDPVSGAIAAYPINLSSGAIGRALLPSPFAAGLGATVASGGADYLYVFARNQVPDLVGYNFDPNTGKLRPVPGGFFQSQSGWANYITVDPVHNVLYQPNFDGSIASYRVQTNGALSFLNFSGVGELIAPETLLVDASGSFLFAVGASASYEQAPPLVTSFRIDAATGDLTFAGQSQSFSSLNYYSSLAAAP